MQLNCIIHFLLYGNNLKAFCVIADAREKTRLVSLNAIPRNRSAPTANVAMETLPAITVNVFKTVSHACDYNGSFHLSAKL